MASRPALARAARRRAMFCEHKTLWVELNTPFGPVFTNEATTVELRTTDGVIAIDSRAQSYLHLTHTTELTLRVGTEFLRFVLKNAAASLREGRLTVLAEEIHKAGAATCSAGSDI